MSHSQIVNLPIMPPELRSRLLTAAEGFPVQFLAAVTACPAAALWIQRTIHRYRLVDGMWAPCRHTMKNPCRYLDWVFFGNLQGMHALTEVHDRAPRLALALRGMGRDAGVAVWLSNPTQILCMGSLWFFDAARYAANAVLLANPGIHPLWHDYLNPNALN